MDANAWVPLAEIARPHGVRGEVKLKLFNKDSDILLHLDEVLVRMPDGEEHEVSVDKARRADQAILMKLYSIDDCDRAGELRGALVCVRRSEFPKLADGEFYACDVIGARVHVGDVNEDVGTVADLKTYPTVDVFVVRAPDGGVWEVPAIAAYVGRIDAQANLIEITTLEGIEREAPRPKKAK